MSGESIIHIVRSLGFYKLPKAEAFAVIGTLLHYYCEENGLPEMLSGTQLMCTINEVNEKGGK